MHQVPRIWIASWLVFATTGTLNAEEPFPLNRCGLLPLPEHQVSFQIDGIEKTRWHFGTEYPRPFFYPFNGPSGTSLTRNSPDYLNSFNFELIESNTAVMGFRPQPGCESGRYPLPASDSGCGSPQSMTQMWRIRPMFR